MSSHTMLSRTDRRYLIITSLACLAGSAHALAPVNWDGEAGDLLWFSDDNWNPNGVPGEMDSVTVDSGGAVTAASMPIEVISVEALSGLRLISSSLKVATDSVITDFYLSGCCATPLDSGGGTITYLGTSEFVQPPAFIGSHVIEGTAIFNNLLFVEELADLTINADATINGGGAQLRAGASASITGTLNLNNATLGSFSANPDATWYFDGGNLNYTGTQDAIITDKVYVTSGSVSVDTKQLEFSEEFVFQDTEVAVSNGGRIVFDAGMPGLDGEVLEVNTFSGDGRIEIQGSSVDMGTASSTTSVTGDGFWVRELLLIDGALSNTGTMQLRGGTIDGDGRLTVDAGSLRVVQGGEINTETIVRSGGSMLLDAQLTLANELRVDSGGTVDLTFSGIQNVSGGTGDPGVVTVFGALRLPNSSSTSPSLEDVALNLRAGGNVVIDDRQFILRGDSELFEGQVTMNDTFVSSYPRMLLSGDADTVHKIGRGVEFISTGTRSELIIGNGVGAQPQVVIDGIATMNLSGIEGVVRVRTPEVMGNEFSSLINQGTMRFERATEFTTRVENEGRLEISGGVTFSNASLINQDDGSVIHNSTLSLGPNSNIVNRGNWSVLLFGVQIISTFDDPSAVRLFSNFGEMRFQASSSFVDVPFLNGGTVIASSAQVSFRNATVRDSEDQAVLQGRWQAINNGKILFPENPPTVLRGPDTEVDADADDMPALNEIQQVESCSWLTAFTQAVGDILFSDSTVEVKENGTFGSDGKITATDNSQVTLNPGATLESDVSITSGSDDIMLPSVTDDITGVIQLSLGEVLPPSISAPTIDIHANLTPIRDDVGVMNTSGMLTIHPTGTLRINARANAQSSSINHTGDMEILGRISITPLKAYEPQIGDSFTIATVSGTIGDLPTQATDATGSGTTYSVSAVDGDVVVTVIASCPADLNMDGTINFFDVSAFLTAFNSMDPIADFDDDGMFNFFDVSAFLVAYNAGCP